ncbi:2-oxo acid dehydrogenase subunit E2 [Candidatus Bathyarchaeota archaeon]|nr:MAG: 2-oxo acid dehydrogenase subunit E2 [Candidatus Bathyarchaeota archaeon]
MVVEVIMPKLGQTMEKGKIVKWLKKEGERVEKGEPLLEIETDKTTLEVEARGSGILRKILAREGEVVPVTKTIGYIAEEGEPLPEEAAPEATAPTPTPTPKAEAPSVEKPKATVRIKASPLAKKIAKEKGVDLTQVTGTGPGGRITKEDVLRYLASKAAAVAPAPPMPVAKPAEEVHVIPMTSMRKAIARKMVYSKTNIPHFYISTEVDMTEAVKMRQSLISTIEAKTGVRLSFTHMLVKAAAMALKEFPQINAVYDGENIKLLGDINIGIAVGLEDGLIVPVLKNADKMSLIQIASEASRLIASAREKRLREDEFVGGTFTISNLGAFDVDSFIAIINPPETAILAVGRIKEKPAVVDNKIEIRKMMTLTLSADHRVVDGVLAAKFLQRVKALLEAPYNLLLPQ